MDFEDTSVSISFPRPLLCVCSLAEISHVLSACNSQARQKVETGETLSLLSIFDLDAEITLH